MIHVQLRGRLWLAVRRAWLRIMRFGVVALLVGFALTEVSANVLNGGHITLFVHLVALVVGAAFAYGAAITVGIFEAIRGLFGALGELETGFRAAAVSPTSGAQRPSGPPPMVDAEPPPAPR